MANVRMVREGSDPARGGPWRVMPLAECRAKLGLQSSNFLCDLTTIPRFGDKTASPAPFRDPRFVVVQLDQAEAAHSQWRPGFYVSDLTPKEAERRRPPLSNFAVNPNADVDYSVVVVADAGDDRVATYIPRHAIDDCFRQHCPLTNTERVGLIGSNLQIISTLIEAKYARGETRPENRYGSTIKRIDLTLDDLTSGPRLDSGRVLLSRCAGFRRAL